LKSIITVDGYSVDDAFSKAFRNLYEENHATTDPDLIKESPLVLSIDNNKEDSLIIKVINQKFCLKDDLGSLISDSKSTIDKVLNHYNNELFKSGKVAWLVDYMNTNPHSRRIIMNIWQDQTDSKPDKDSPCVVYFWYRIISGSLHLHTHMRANDAFRKFMLNLEIFVSLQKYIAELTNNKLGKYVHFVDSFHFYKFNEIAIKKYYETKIFQK